IGLLVEGIVDHPVTIVVEVVADLDVRSDVTDLLQEAIQALGVTRVAGAHTDIAVAAVRRAAGAERQAGAPGSVRVVIDDAVAVVVEIVAALDAVVGPGALAAVGGIVVGIAVPEVAGAHRAVAADAHAFRIGIQKPTVVAAGATILRIGIEIEAIVDDAV